MKSRFYHIYNDPEVKANLSRAAESHEALPDLVTNGYYYLGLDWLETLKRRKGKIETPPVMITVCNSTETADRAEFAAEIEPLPFPPSFANHHTEANLIHSKICAR